MTKVMPKSTTNPKIQSTSTTNTAIRIPSDIYKKISTQADQENKTVSSIINEVLRKYVTWDQFVSDIGFVFLQKPFVRSIFEQVSDEDIIRAAQTSCYTGMRDAISFIHGRNDVDAIIDVIKLWLSASKFTNTIINSENSVEIRIQHNLGQKCSLYMGALLTKLFADLNMKPEKSMLKDHSMILTFKKLQSKK
jgi:hypothetical protein